MNFDLQDQIFDRNTIFPKMTRPSGGFAMVANDQRESLRTMFQDYIPGVIPDSTLEEFKAAVAEILSPYASAMLFDRLYGWKALDTAKSSSLTCGLLVSADRLIQEPGKLVTGTELDDELDYPMVVSRGAIASKFLLIWKGEQNSEKCLRLAEEFVKRCHRVGLLAVVEAMVYKPDGVDVDAWDKSDAILEAARYLGKSNPDLYKAEVPMGKVGDPAEIQERASLISNVLPCPWVVLSSGVPAQQFPQAVEAACKGGASGFLAGRGIWRDAIRADLRDYREQLKTISIPRLIELNAIVDRYAKPWPTALS